MLERGNESKWESYWLCVGDIKPSKEQAEQTNQVTRSALHIVVKPMTSLLFSINQWIQGVDCWCFADIISRISYYLSCREVVDPHPGLSLQSWEVLRFWLRHSGILSSNCAGWPLDFVGEEAQKIFILDPNYRRLRLMLICAVVTAKAVRPIAVARKKLPLFLS